MLIQGYHSTTQDLTAGLNVTFFFFFFFFGRGGGCTMAKPYPLVELKQLNHKYKHIVLEQDYGMKNA